MATEENKAQDAGTVSEQDKTVLKLGRYAVMAGVAQGILAERGKAAGEELEPMKWSAEQRQNFADQVVYLTNAIMIADLHVWREQIEDHRSAASVAAEPNA